MYYFCSSSSSSSSSRGSSSIIIFICRGECGIALTMGMLFGEMSLVKPESLYAYYNALLIQRINFLDMYVLF